MSKKSGCLTTLLCVLLVLSMLVSAFALWRVYEMDQTVKDLVSDDREDEDEDDEENDDKTSHGSGKSVVGAYWNEDGLLILVMSDGSEMTVETITPPEIEGCMTRDEWIHVLLETVGADRNVEAVEPLFTDIGASQYREDIAIAVYYGWIANSEEEFYPAAQVTREFAAATAICAMGYYVTEEDQIDCSDWEEIQNPAYAAVAIELGLLQLENHCFYPQRLITQDELQNILNIVISTIHSTEVSGENVSSELSYSEDVIVVNGSGSNQNNAVEIFEDITYTDDGRVVLPAVDGLSNLQYGQIIVLNDADAIEVVSATEDAGYVWIEYTEPELSECVDSIYEIGEVEIDFSNFIPADNVTLTVEEEDGETVPVSASNQAHPSFEQLGAINLASPGSIGLNKNLSLNGTVKLSKHTSLDFNIKYSVSKLEYLFDVDLRRMNVKNAYVKMENSLSMTGSYKINASKELWDDYEYVENIKIGEVPLWGNTWTGFVIEVNLVLGAEGAVSLELSANGTHGFQVLNNRPRSLTSVRLNPPVVSLTGAGTFGVSVGVCAELFDLSLVSFEVESGVKMQGNITFRSTGTCADIGAHMYLTIGAMDETFIAKHLPKVKFSAEIFYEGHTPWSMPIAHWENFEKVPECTYKEGGVITGRVANADNRSQYIENAKIEIYNTDNEIRLVETVYTDASGQYQAAVDDGIYLIVISAEGYLPFESSQNVMEGQTIYVETYLMVAGDENLHQTGVIAGKITNAVTGYIVSNADISIHKGWNNLYDEEVVATVTGSPDGYYSVELPIGNYTVIVEKENYTRNHINVAVTTTGNYECNVVISPNSDSEVPTGDLRVVLTWGEYPSDLDSHMFGPLVSDPTQEFHVYYGDKTYYDDGETQCFLDVDDVSSYGPETTTVYQMNMGGVYHFYVHDFTNGGNGYSKDMSNSDAKVQVYIGEQIVTTYYIPVDREGTIWHVFDYDSEFGKITPVNTIGNEYDHAA